MAARGLTDIYARPPNLPCMMCSARDDIVSKSLIVFIERLLIISVCNFWVGVLVSLELSQF